VGPDVLDVPALVVGIGQRLGGSGRAIEQADGTVEGLVGTGNVAVDVFLNQPLYYQVTPLIGRRQTLEMRGQFLPEFLRCFSIFADDGGFHLRQRVGGWRGLRDSGAEDCQQENEWKFHA
jgi:hypothetical protein